MKNNTEFFHDDWITTCDYTTKYGTFRGIATCHPDDKDMQSERTGEQIAYHRALIKSLQHKRDNILKPRLCGLQQLFYSMVTSKKYNPDSFEAKRLQRHIQQTEKEITKCKIAIINLRTNLRNYIAEKEKLYQKIRSKQNKKDTQKSKI